MKILIVDDDAVARMSLASILSAAGATPVQAEDGEQAWDLLASGLRPALCCTDVNMPRLDGIGLLRRASGHPVLRHLPFVLISAVADQQTLQAAVEHGARGYVLKPFLVAQTRGTVEAVLRERRTQRSEHFLETRRRLGGELSMLEHELVALRDALWALANGEALADDGFAALASQARRLGLWRCAALLEEALAPGVAAGSRDLLLREAAWLAGDQLEELRQLAPAP